MIQNFNDVIRDLDVQVCGENKNCTFYSLSEFLIEMYLEVGQMETHFSFGVDSDVECALGE